MLNWGVNTLLSWLQENGEDFELSDGATDSAIEGVERSFQHPLPSGMKTILTIHDGGELPTGHLLAAGISGPKTIATVINELADPENRFLPFFLDDDNKVALAFDTHSGPVSDTWPIVDINMETKETALVHRTFDGWCESAVADWDQDEEEFDLEAYLTLGERHVAIEPDVGSAHATLAHALRRSGRPEDAMVSYLNAARCIPSVPWCDWEALQLAVILNQPIPALEATSRLASKGPDGIWKARECSPRQVTDVVMKIAARANDPRPWLHVLNLLARHVSGKDEQHILDAHFSLTDPETEAPLPAGYDIKSVARVPNLDDWWGAARAAYLKGDVRPLDMILDADLCKLGRVRPLADLLRERREF